jgi:hypothetical protein
MYIAKLTYNSNNWIKPSGSNGKLISNNFVQFYESENGFGWEEWNFSPSRIFNNTHYGFIQAVHNDDNFRRKTFNNLLLYTQLNNFYYAVAFFEEIKTLGFHESKEIKNEIAHSYQMKIDISDVKGNLTQFEKDINLSINFKYDKCNYLFNEKLLDKLKFNPPVNQNTFKKIFEVTNEKKIMQLQNIIESNLH